MGWLVKHVQDHRSGRKSFRRAYPPHLRPYLSGTQLRVSLGRPEDPGFLSAYENAATQWEADVALAERKFSAAFDPLDAPTVAYLAEAFRVETLEDDDHARWDTSERELYRQVAAQLGGARVAFRSAWKGREGARWASKARETIEAALVELPALRANGDLEAIVARWRESALDLAEARGYVIDPTDSLGISALCRAMNDAAISSLTARLSRLDGPEYIPTPEEPEKPIRSPLADKPAVSLLTTYDAYAEAQGIKPTGRKEGRNYVRHLTDFLGHDDAAAVTRADVVRWRDHLLDLPTRLGAARKPVTVRDKYLTPVRCTLGWAVEEKLIPANVAADVKVRIPKSVSVRDPDFTMEEALAILRASLEPPTGNLSAPHARARRWIPWLCAYTGCRVNEMSQLRKRDIREEEGVWIVNITPEAGDVKTGKFRATPIHSHLIEQGFLKMVRGLPEGPLFYDPEQRRSAEGEGNRHVKKVGERLAAWVRKDVGITDPSIKPNHAWRHLFKTLSAEAGIEERVADAVQGHAPRTTGRKYGKVNLRTKAAAVDAFPRFVIDATSPAKP